MQTVQTGSASQPLKIGRCGTAPATTSSRQACLLWMLCLVMGLRSLVGQHSSCLCPKFAADSPVMEALLLMWHSEHLRRLPDIEGLTGGSTSEIWFELKNFNGTKNVTSCGVADEEGGNRRQELIMVASLLDKAPNLAGLSRTCEVPYPVLEKCHILRRP